MSWMSESMRTAHVDFLGRRPELAVELVARLEQRKGSENAPLQRETSVQRVCGDPFPLNESNNTVCAADPEEVECGRCGSNRRFYFSPLRKGKKREIEYLGLITTTKILRG